MKAPDWFPRGLCSGADTDRWLTERLPGGTRRTARAKRLCKGCPVLTDCARFAVTTHSTDYVFAGVALDKDGNTQRYDRLRRIAGMPPRKKSAA